MISIKDIAKECKVSVATVSKALNDQSDISKSTKEKVRRVAKKLGYTTNVAARALKTNRTYNLGILFADDRAGLSHEYFSMILGSFQKEAEKNGYDITFINHSIAGTKTTYLKHVEYRSLDGLCIMTADFHDPEIVELCRSKFPVVTIDYVFDDCAAVISDNSRGMDALVRYAYSKGHRKIAYIYGDETDVTNDRLSSFNKTCSELGLEIPPEYKVKGSFHDIVNCSEKTRILLDLPDPPTLIIFPDDYSFIGGQKVISSRGLTLPNDISAIGYDGISMAKIMNITTYEQNTESLGQTAARKLLQLINQPELPPEHVLISGNIITGTTVKDIN